MAQPCKICTHEQRIDIEREIADEKPMRDIAGRYGTSKSAVSRHKNECMGNAVEVAREEKQKTIAESLFAGMETLEEDIEKIKQAALKKEDYRVALLAIDKFQNFMRMRGDWMMKFEELRNDRKDIRTDQAWISARGIILKALLPYDEARKAVAEALERANL